jgi:hypothetical protein
MDDRSRFGLDFRRRLANAAASETFNLLPHFHGLIGEQSPMEFLDLCSAVRAAG